MKPRVLFAGLFHETHTFIEEVTRWADFDVATGEAVFDKRGDASPTDGFLEEAQAQGFDVIPTLDARATPSGTVTDETFETFWHKFELHARPALAAGVDALFLVLHGAMVTPSHPDVEGEFLSRIRALPGAANLPVFGVLDLHANVTARMCSLANGLVAYRENPHTDAKQAAQRATALLARCLRENRIPRMVWARPPLMWAPPGTGTDIDPMLSLKIFANKLETLQREVWACNIAPGFSFADTPQTGLTISLVTTAPREAAHAHLETGARLAWSLRQRGDIRYPSVEKIVAQLQPPPAGAGPVLLVEPADNIGGGAPGDGTAILRALLAHRIDRALVVINDPISVAALADAAPGDSRPLEIGGRGSRLDAGPVSVDATLVSKSSGSFELEDKQSHLASMSGTRFEMGNCAVVRCGGVTILLTSKKTPPFDLGQLRSQGLEPRQFAVIGVKAAVAHRRAYDPIAHASFYVDTPGPCSSDLVRFPWRHLVRPVWPLDPDIPFTCQFS